MIKYTLPILISFLAGCVSQEEEPSQECLYIVDRIINIQNIREVARKDFDITVRYKKDGKVSDAAWHHEYHRWMSQENKLASSANDLYEKARVNSCFHQEEQMREGEPYPGQGACELCGQIDPCEGCITPVLLHTYTLQHNEYVEVTSKPKLKKTINNNMKKINSILPSIIKR